MADVRADEAGDAHGPDERGRFGPYGGRYIPEALMAAVDELSAESIEAMTGRHPADLLDNPSTVEARVGGHPIEGLGQHARDHLDAAEVVALQRRVIER